MDERVWHYIKPNETTRLPRRHIFLDTEARTDRIVGGHIQRWRIAVAAFRDAPKGRQTKEETRVYRSAEQLWRDVSEYTRPRNRTVLWAHNLGYDVRISDALRILPALGWRLEAHNLTSRGTWLQWRRDGASLTCVDSASVFPVPLAHVATTFLRAKLPLPTETDSDEYWEARCRRDVEILRDAIVAYLGWLEESDLGNWQMTGAGQSYAAWRHKFLTHKMLVHCDEDALKAERRAMWTGRCEAYFHGRTKSGGVDEWDLSLAYARVAMAEAVPTKLLGMVGPHTDLSGLLSRSGVAVLAEVAIQTAVPVVPTEIQGRMAWPVGQFETTLWTPELALARSVGAEVTVRRAWVYRAEPALRAWAQWIIHALETGNDSTPAWQRIVLKHWARALIGRFAMCYTRWEPLGTTQSLETQARTVFDLRDGSTWTMSHVGHDAQRSAGTAEWDQSQPAITGFIMSACRVWLWNLMQAMPERSVVYADTDSLLVLREFHDNAAALAASSLGEGLRLKSTWPYARILGPRQIFTGDAIRIAGVPRKAVRHADGTIYGETWQSLGAALRANRPDAVLINDKMFRPKGIDKRRVATPSGWTEPIRVGEGVTL